tara:strand:- start:453 stop:674 length:222 start_codon:yes stop_codon:yes gene_type:complete
MYVFILLLIIFFASLSRIENFTNFLFFPIPVGTRNTRGMSYDIRCLPEIKKHYVPWGYGTIYPNHYGNCIRDN